VHWQWPVGAVLAFLLALLTTPAGVSGAVLLLPVQLSVLHVPSPSVTPTNLLFNVAATPGAMLRFAREHRLRGPLTGLLVAGTLPGVIAGAVLRVELFSGQRSFTVIAGLVLLPLGLWLLLGAQNLIRPRPAPTRRHRQATWLLALVVGVVGGLYGIGGGSILAPLLIALGYSVYEVAPATLAATFLTSVVGIATYQVLQAIHGGAIAPQWLLGACLGAGGFAGSYCGARLQRRLPERNLRRLLGLIACLVAVRYLQTAAASTGSPGKRRATPSQPESAGWRLARHRDRVPGDQPEQVAERRLGGSFTLQSPAASVPAGEPAGSSVRASTWRGRTAPKCRRSKVASFVSSRRSTIASTAASTKPIAASA